MDLYHELHANMECKRPYPRKEAPNSCPKMWHRYTALCSKPFFNKKKGKYINRCMYRIKGSVFYLIERSRSDWCNWCSWFEMWPPTHMDCPLTWGWSDQVWGQRFVQAPRLARGRRLNVHCGFTRFLVLDPLPHIGAASLPRTPSG